MELTESAEKTELLALLELQVLNQIHITILSRHKNRLIIQNKIKQTLFNR